MKLQLLKGITSKRIGIFIQDSSSSVGAGLTGLLFNSAGLTWHYWREDEGNVNATAVTLVTATRGTFASGGFIVKDATNMPGFYEIGIPNAALASGADWVTMVLRGATNMAPLTLEIQLTSLDMNTPMRGTDSAGIKKNAALSDFEFVAYDSTDHFTPITARTFSGTRSIDGGAFVAVSGSFAEVANGIYQFDALAADTNGDLITWRFTATGADDVFITFKTVP